MTWQDINADKQDPAAAEQADNAEKNQQAIDQCARRAVEPQQQLPLRRYLQQIAYSRSFRPGRPAEDTAWSEGYRALAVEILSRGGMTHD